MPQRIFCLVLGYAFGLFQTGYILSRANHMDIRSYGSGNSGATNVLRVMGVKSGVVVFLGDALKMVFAVLVTRFIFASSPDRLYLYMMWTALGVILGHDFPFYMNFKGGKGISAMGGLTLAMDIRLMCLCIAVIVLVVALTRFVSLGSIIIVTLIAAWLIWFGWSGAYGLDHKYIAEYSALSVILCVIAIYRHRANIKRLLSGTERKLGEKK